MIRRLQIILVAALLGMAGQLPAAAPSTRSAPSTQPYDEQIPPLLVQLGDNDFRVRQVAQERLVALGEEAVPMLRNQLPQIQDPEVRSRVQVAIRQIEEAARSAPTLLTVHFKDAAFADAMAEVSRQAKTTIDLYMPGPPPATQPPRITYDAERQPFWRVVPDIARQAGFGIERGGTGDVMVMRQNASTLQPRPEFDAGRFVVQAMSVSRNRQVNFSAGGAVSGSCNMQIRLLADPKFKIIQASNPISIVTAVDENGESLVLNRGSASLSSVSSGWMIDLTAQLSAGARAGDRIAELRGTATCVVQTASEKWEVDNILQANNIQKIVENGLTTLSIKSFQNGGNVYHAVVGIVMAQPPAGGARDPLSDQQYLARTISLFDAQGRQLRPSANRIESSANNSWLFRFSFVPQDDQGKPTGEPAKLVWDIPTDFEVVEVPIEFKNLPLP
jgi:hypothetical protein